MHTRLHLGKLASGKFWNAVLQFVDPVVSVEYLNPFGIKDFETDKLVCVNVKATDQRGRVFIVEIQIVVQSSFAKRAVFYAYEAYTDQLRAGQGYGDLKATYSICLLMRNLWDDEQLHHQFRLVDRESGRVLEENQRGQASLKRIKGVRPR
jgi:predicted transposase/invertase (TIGR01784 family)